MLNKIISFFLPASCALCHVALTSADDNICQECALDIKFLQNTCQSCGQPLEDKIMLICGQCTNNPPLWQSFFVPMAYNGATRFMVKALKFNRQLSLIKILADRFVKAIKQQDIEKPDYILPVPLHRARLAKRGFNQSFELAKVVGHRLEIPLINNVCRRVKNTTAQTGLSGKDRRQNLKQAFVLQNPKVIAQKHIVLFDDVYTTGSTLKELASVCKTAKRIDVWCIAKVVSLDLC